MKGSSFIKAYKIDAVFHISGTKLTAFSMTFCISQAPLKNWNLEGGTQITVYNLKKTTSIYGFVFEIARLHWNTKLFVRIVYKNNQVIESVLLMFPLQMSFTVVLGFRLMQSHIYTLLSNNHPACNQEFVSLV